LKELGRIDILVNNAAGGSYAGAMEMSETDFEADLRQSLTSVFMCSKAAAKVMLEQKAGSIINISSGYSQLPSLGMPAYGAAKAGINSLTRTMAWELAPYVRVNAILPGCIRTEGAAMMMVGTAHDKILKGEVVPEIWTGC
jgi:NAD(P)-dependent dehydrogenase (short-subunit alcohol dehydrogenase family)